MSEEDITLEEIISTKTSSVNEDGLSKDRPSKKCQDVHHLDNDGDKVLSDDVKSQEKVEINLESTNQSMEGFINEENDETLSLNIVSPNSEHTDFVESTEVIGTIVPIIKKEKMHKNIVVLRNICHGLEAKKTSDLNRIQNKNSNPELAFQCSFCPRKFDIIWRLKYHERLRHIRLFELKCEFCGEEFRAVHKLTNHLLDVHHKDLENELGTTIPKHKCSKCENLYDSKESLNIHICIIKHEYKKPSYKSYFKKPIVPKLVCQSCGKQVKGISQLKSHEFKAHGKKSDVVGKYCCSDCDKEFPLKERLHNHITNVHKPKKVGDFSCVECGKQYNSIGKLNWHNKSHDEKHKHSCDECGSSFNQIISLKNHVSIKHKGERNFKCDTCWKGFTRYTSLKQHETLHTGKSKPFQCTYCDICYGEKRNMVKHVTTKHPEESISFKKQTIDGEFKIVTP